MIALSGGPTDNALANDEIIWQSKCSHPGLTLLLLEEETLVSRRVSGLICLLLCWLVAGVSMSAMALEIEGVPERDELDARLATLEDMQSEPNAAQLREQQALEAALGAYDRLLALDERQRLLEERVERAPDELVSLERQLAEITAEGEPVSLEQLNNQSLEELDTQQAQAVTQLQQLQNQQAEISAQLLSAQTLPERAQQSIATALQRIERLRRDHDARDALLSEQERSTNSDTQLIQLRLERVLAEREVTFHQRELSTNSRLREIAQQRRELVALQIARQEKALETLQSVIDHKRRTQSEQAIADAARDNSLIGLGNPLISRAQEANQTLSQELLRTTDRANSVVRENIDTQRQLDYTRQLQRSLNEQIEAIRGSQLLSRILREQRQSLLAVNERRDLQDEIADLRLKQFELIRQRDELRHGERLASQRLAEAGLEQEPELLEALTRLYQARRELVERLEQAYGTLLSAAIELQLNHQQLVSITQDLRATIEEQLFWVANSRPLDLNWLRSLPTALHDEWYDGEWRSVVSNRLSLDSWSVFKGTPVILLAGVLLLLRRKIKHQLGLLHTQIGRLKSDTQLHTPKAVLLNALLALPLATLLAGVGLLLNAPVLMQVALLWAVVAWGRRILVVHGVAEQHFKWPTGYTRRLRSLLVGLGIAMVPVVAIAAMAEEIQTPLAMRPFAFALLTVGLVAMSVLLVKLVIAHLPFFGIRLFRLTLGLSMAAVPLVMMGLVAWGYEYTALKLIQRFVVTLYILGMWVVVEATVVRSLAVAARRLAYQRALAKRHAQLQEGAEGSSEVVEEPPLDMEQISNQSLRLSKLILLIAFSALIYGVWSDLLGVLNYLDQVALVNLSDEALVEDVLSISDFFTALFIIAVTTIMARNLPGLLEVMVLSRLALKQGSAYAISSLLSYTIVGVGVVMSLAALGVSWDKLQWLVAALSVGLGFGLQEIFANFISGLIILFERPIRIGDTITLGNLHGTVNRIRIRATTVTDFDRKEIIIPNKTFVTDQLINWSLSDNVTRVVLTYGVAHGSDLAMVHRLLHQAAAENSRVLSDPEPQVFCVHYGPHNFSFELRIFVNDIMDRLYASDEVNCRVDELFRSAGIRVAFEQMDVWLHNDRQTPVQVQSIAGATDRQTE
jgi:potassium efflux system protein